MRLTLALALVLLLSPTALTAHPAAGSGVQAVAPLTDLSAAKKKKVTRAPKEEYLKAAPGSGPSGPKK